MEGLVPGTELLKDSLNDILLCDRRSSRMVLRSIGISGEAVADEKILASLGTVEVPLKVWLGVGSSGWLYQEVVGSVFASLLVGLWGSWVPWVPGLAVAS